MLYSIVKNLARLAIPVHCRDIAINKKELLKLDGPLLLAVNHPNSFLDAIILCTLFDIPVYSLARGDAFKNKVLASILFSFKILPVYRASEGVENLEENYKTFDLCKNIFKKNGAVLIFCEGRCINEWHLRPLKKGTARLAISSWQDGIDLKVLPVAINYSSFKKFGKNVKIFFGDAIHKEDIDYNDTHGNAIQQFNKTLQLELNKYVFEIAKEDKTTLREFYIKQSLVKRVLLFIPAVLGILVHAPLFYFIKWISGLLIKEVGHYDSKIVGFCFLLYPLFLVTVSLVLFYFTNGWYALAGLLLLPFTAWSYVQLKKQLD